MTCVLFEFFASRSISSWFARSRSLIHKQLHHTLHDLCFYFSYHSEFFFNIALFCSIHRTKICLHVISDVGHPSIRRTRLVHIVFGRCDTFNSRLGSACQSSQACYCTWRSRQEAVAYAGRNRSVTQSMEYY
jgi:hypothetical protein